MNENEQRCRQFWLVWNKERGTYSTRHEIMSDARSEARTLAEKFPGEEFHVMASLCTVCAPKPIAMEVFHA